MTDVEYNSKTAIKRDLTDAKIRLDRAIEQYSQSQQLGESQQIVSREELHSAVVGFFWRLRPHINNSNAWNSIAESDDYDGDEIWSGIEPESGRPVTIQGLKDIEKWVDKHVEKQTTREHPNFAIATETANVPVRLPPQAAIECAKVLISEFDYLGWNVSPDKTPHDEPNETDLAYLLQRRDQVESLKQLPERFKGPGSPDPPEAEDE